jgi:DNA-binding IclR family transcriptional regulator
MAGSATVIKAMSTSSELSSEVLAALLADHEEDTAAGIAEHAGLPVAEVQAALLELKGQRLVRRWESHWQLTTTGSAEASARGAR